MRKLQVIDIAFNVILPILLGVIIYYTADCFSLNQYIRNQLPDGLWAYSLVSSILIIWNRKIKIIWILMVAIFFILFEVLQYFQIISGTADYLDIIIYFAFSIISLFLNKYFLTTFINKT
jgi:hypothetical protein